MQLQETPSANPETPLHPQEVALDEHWNFWSRSQPKCFWTVSARFPALLYFHSSCSFDGPVVLFSVDDFRSHSYPGTDTLLRIYLQNALWISLHLLEQRNVRKTTTSISKVTRFTRVGSSVSLYTRHPFSVWLYVRDVSSSRSCM